MEKKFTNKAQLGVDLSDGSDNTCYSLIVISDNEEDFKKKIKIMSHAPEMLELLETIENDDNLIPNWLFERIKNVIKKATE